MAQNVYTPFTARSISSHIGLWRLPIMADFVQQSITKSTTRTLTNPIADADSFETIVNAVVTDNPFTCTAYTVGGVAMDPVTITKRSFGSRLVWEDNDAKNVGSTTEKYSTKIGFNAGSAVIMANAPLATAHTGTAIHDPDKDTFSATLRCHDPNGEIFYVNFACDRLSVTSYSDDAILGKVDTWADTIAALA